VSGGDQVVWWKGHRFDARTRDQLEEAERLSGLNLAATQGSYSSRVGASAGTHSGGGAWDGVLRGTTASMNQAVEALRRVGMAAWVRTQAQGFVPHVHAISVQPGGKHDRGVLSASAHAQVIDYYEGRNGLRGRGADDGPRQWVGVTWETYNDGKDGDDDMTPEQAQKLGEIHWAINQIRGTDLPPIRKETDRLPRVDAKGAETHWGVLNDPSGARHMIAAVQAQLRRIEEHLGMNATAAMTVEEPPDADD
jgi:hypothetical protein